MKKFLFAILAVLITSTLSTRPASAAQDRVAFSDCGYVSASDESIVREYADWIMSAMDSGGVAAGDDELAIARYPDASFAARNISSYEGNYAAIGLLNAYEMTGDAKYKDAAWKWLNWYSANKDATTGYTTDYSNGGSDGVWVTTGDQDSTDSYAATWLVAFYTAYKLDPLSPYVAGLLPEVELIHTAMMSTLDPADGLTNAKPSYPAKSLADNAEVGLGLNAAQALATLNGDSDLNTLSADQEVDLYAGIESELWNNPSGLYGWAKSAGGVDQSSYSYFYADSYAQFISVGYGVSTGTRAQTLINDVVTNFPDWTDPTSQIYLNGSVVTSDIGFWPIIGIARELTGADTSADFAALHANIQSLSKAWPFNTHRAGDMITWMGLRNGCQSAHWLEDDYTPALARINTNQADLEVVVPSLDANYSLDGVVPKIDTETYTAQLNKKSGASTVPVAEFEALAADNNYAWSSVTADVDLASFSSVTHNLIGSPAVSGTNYSLLVPKRAEDSLVRICPDATILSEVEAGCSGVYELSEDDDNVSVVTIDGVDFWKVAGVSGTGGMSVAGADSTTTLADTGASSIQTSLTGVVVLGLASITLITALRNPVYKRYMQRPRGD